MISTEDSYRACERIAMRSGSSFFRSFNLLRVDRRKGMVALYAFARIIDDLADNSSSEDLADWDFSSLSAWISRLVFDDFPESTSTIVDHHLGLVRPALRDTVERFAIPIQLLQELLSGVNHDVAGLPIETWSDLHRYCYEVASTIGLACLDIWGTHPNHSEDNFLRQSAVDCGIAFQLTNILRDIEVDAKHGRAYLPNEELRFYGIDRTEWISAFGDPTEKNFASIQSRQRELCEVYIERANAYYESGWNVFPYLAHDGKRMFSLMWHTYRALLTEIEKRRLLNCSSGKVSKGSKIRIIASHLWTPAFRRVAEANAHLLNHDDKIKTQIADGPDGAPAPTKPSVAVIGGGLAGINAAIHCARHGCDVVLYESKSKLGGRAGSYWDKDTNRFIDYCQHVGMLCCTELRRWIDRTGQTDLWQQQDSLHFVSRHGKKLCVKAWPLPAPFHLAGLLLGWPDLPLLDRARVGLGLTRLIRIRQTESNKRIGMLDWLRSNHQSERAIQNFWSTILVSALGEQLDKVNLEISRKVLVDGFAAERNGHQLLVPTRPLSDLINLHAANTLRSLGVTIESEAHAEQLTSQEDGSWNLGLGSAEKRTKAFDSVILAVPWYRIHSILPKQWMDRDVTASTKQPKLESSPISGVHTWWDQAWLKEPHAIVIDRLCQWIFPAPNGLEQDVQPTEKGLHYYQIVISGSRNLTGRSSAEIAELIKSEIEELFPESKSARMVRFKVVTDPNSVFSVSPGCDSSRWNFDRFAREGIFIAGDWTNTGWPATMEGALRSGLTAAQGALARSGRIAKLLN